MARIRTGDCDFKAIRGVVDMSGKKRDVDSLHRGAKILVDLKLTDWDGAYDLLPRYKFAVVIGSDASSSVAGQHALLTIVNCGVRCRPGGAVVHGVPPRQENLTALGEGAFLLDSIEAYGGVVSPKSTGEFDLPVLLIGDAGATSTCPVIRVTWGGWRSGVSPEHCGIRLEENADFAPAAILAAALGVAEVFGSLVGQDIGAGRRTLGLNLRDSCAPWTESGAEPDFTYIPQSVWLLGLGHLGQAFAWVAASLPYPPDRRLGFLLQDCDIVKDANLSTSLLSFKDNLGFLKSRVVSTWLESRGYSTKLLEHPFAGDLKLAVGEPRILLAGLDNFPARRLLEGPACDLVVDVGLGAIASDYDGICLQTFTTTSRAATAFKEPERATPITTSTEVAEAYNKLGLDACGIHLASNAAVGVPFVGVSAACLAIAEICRAIEGIALTDTLALSLSTLPDVDSVSSGNRCRNPGYVKL